jgi:hypothetical protein
MIDLALGLVVLAKSPQVAAKYSKQLVEHKFHKATPLEHHWNTSVTPPSHFCNATVTLLQYSYNTTITLL